MAVLKWVQVDADFLESDSCGLLARGCGWTRFEALGRMWAVWRWAARNTRDGVVRTDEQQALLEEAAGWTGGAGEFVAMLVRAGLLVPEDDGRYLRGFRERYGKLLEKREKDASRKRVQRTAPECPQEIQRTALGNPADGAEISDGRPAEKLAPSTAPSPFKSLFKEVGGVGEEGPPLIERMGSAFRELRGTEYGLTAMGGPNRRDASALAELLAYAKNDHAEIERRWRIGLVWRGFPECSNWKQLAEHWDRYAKPQDLTPRFGPKPRRDISASDYLPGDGAEIEGGLG